MNSTPRRYAPADSHLILIASLKPDDTTQLGDNELAGTFGFGLPVAFRLSLSSTTYAASSRTCFAIAKVLFFSRRRYVPNRVTAWDP